MSRAAPQLSSFGQGLRLWRRQRGLSQLDLALLAKTSPRHLSFIETGRSRPGRELVLRLAQCLDVPIRERNLLLTAAGLRPEFAERDLNDERARPFRQAVEAVLRHHDPYPACAFDGLGRVVLANTGFRAFSPGLEGLSPEQSVDLFFAPGPMRETLENWDELAWLWVDRQRQEAARGNNSRLLALVERALGFLKDVPRPPAAAAGETDVIAPRFRVGDQVIRTFATVMRFESAREITLSELRVELIFPLDDAGDAFFRSLIAGSG